MIDSIAEIGKAYREKGDLFDLVIEHPQVEKIIAICIDTATKTAKVCDEGDATEEKTAKALYVKPPSKGPGAAPTAQLNKKNPEKTINDKIVMWFKKRKKQDIADIISKIDVDSIKEIASEAKSALLTVKIDGKWPAEVGWIVNEFKKYIEEKMYVGIYGGSKAESRGIGTCAICGKKGEVYGFVLPWAGMKFGTADKPGFFENLDVTEAWKVLPICKECAWNIRIGWNVLTDREAKYTVGGLNYLVVPSKGASDEDISDFIESIEFPKSKFAVFSELAEAEEMIEDIETNIDLLVYRKEQAKMEVYLLEQNIPPGVFRKIRTKNYQVAKILGWKQNNKAPLAILLAYIEILNAVYSDERSKTKKLKELAQIIHALIREQKWPGTKYACFTTYIEKKAHDEQRGLDFAYIAPLFVYLYFTGGDKLSESIVESINFPSRTAEFAFWTGVLARHVVEMQKEAGSQPGTEPFRKRIRKVRMNVHQLQRLFTEAFEKAKTYSEILGEAKKRRWITWTNSIIEKCASKATNLDAATPDEIGFFFTLGYGLYWKIVKPEGEKEGEENGE